MCYTTDPNVEWDFCDVPICEVVDANERMKEVFGSVCYNCTTEKCGHPVLLQKDYRGKINVTESNRTCQAWSVHEPHEHYDVTEAQYPIDGLE